MNPKFLLIAIFMAFAAASCNPQTSGQVLSKEVLTIGKTSINVEIADTEALRDQGLSDRISLAENSGMLFVFDKPGRYGFWMKDMNFPLDFIWIYQGKVVEINSDVPIQPGVTEAQLKVYTPTQSVDSMVEVNAGFAAKNGIKVGDLTDLTNR